MGKKRKYAITEPERAAKSRKIDSSSSKGSQVNTPRKLKKTFRKSEGKSKTAFVKSAQNCDSVSVGAKYNRKPSKQTPSDVHRPSTHTPSDVNKGDEGKTTGIITNNIKSNDIIKKKKQSSCMKHKKRDKVHSVKRRPKKWKKSKRRPKSESKSKGSVDGNESRKTDDDKVKVPLQHNLQTISTNWKQLQKKLHINPKRKHSVETKIDGETASTGDVKPSTLAKSKSEPEIWFDDVDEVLIEASKTRINQQTTPASQWVSDQNPLVKPESFSGLTKIIAMDCEMVGTGRAGEDSMLARVSIVNQYGQCCYDKLVRPTDKVTDYRTQYSGIRSGDLTHDKAEDFKVVQKEVDGIIQNRLLVGHAIHNDLKVLFLDHPRKAIRDTSKYKPFKRLFQGRTPGLKKLSDQVLGVQVQEGEHNSIQDAQATMRLYTMYRQTWEKDLKLRRKLQANKMAAIDKRAGDRSDEVTSTLPHSDDSDG